MQITRLALALCLATSSPLAMGGDGASIYKTTCAACHGPNAQGQSALNAPPLSGQTAEYLVKQLRAFRAGWRGAGDGPASGMRAVAQSLPDEASLRQVATYVSGLKVTAPTPVKSLDATAVLTGKGLFGICIGCHGSQGEGTTLLGAPRINHLPSGYLEDQLRAYRDGRRGTHEDDTQGRQMRQVALDALADEASIRQVVAYMTTLRSGSSR